LPDLIFAGYPWEGSVLIIKGSFLTWYKRLGSKKSSVYVESKKITFNLGMSNQVERLFFMILQTFTICSVMLVGCNVSASLTDVSPTENSWMLHPLDKMSLGYFAPDRTIPSLNSDF
jgi:hypothetical protein